MQTPSQKAFVLLQSAIGQHFLEDYTLRQEMSLSVEYASRVLTASEEYSIEESRHGEVALQSLILRRCLATSLWGANDNVLNQLRGVGAKTAAKLAMNKLRTFEDILSKSSNEIEQAFGRKSPFGQELKKIASKIMSRSLTISAHVEGLESSCKPNELVCTLVAPYDSFGSLEKDEVDESRIVTYTLAVHTDRPGGSLMFRTEISGPSSHRISCPEKFGRLYIHLVSNLVGLDEKVTIEGNDQVKKSSFMLSPLNVKATRKNISTASKNKEVKYTSKNLESMVEGVEDLRVLKSSSTTSKKRSISQLCTPATIKRRVPNPLSEKSASPFSTRNQILVTPSPSNNVVDVIC